MQHKIITRKRPVIQANGKVKRTGQPVYIVQYTAGRYWHEQQFDTRQQAKDFINSLAA